MASVLIILYLIVLEGLLSFDNALALAALVKSRLHDPADQKRALTYGIWGAYIFRVIVIFSGVWLMQHNWVKLAAGGYLIWLATKELLFKKTGDEKPSSGLIFLRLSALWSTILCVELMDIMFSVDSIGVALAVSDVRWVLIAGAFFGILMMRVAASLFIRLIERFPILEKTAFVLVGLAGINVCLKVFDYALPEAYFFALLGSIFVGSMAFTYKEVSHESV